MVTDVFSTGRIPVSTILLTKNAAATLPDYFASMRRVDDIVVLDGGSTDATLALAQSETAVRVFAQPKEYLDENGYIIDFSGVRNYGYRLAKHRWILYVDADEAATPDLLDEVAEVIRDGQPGVYYCRRQFSVNRQPVVQFACSTSDHLRLFHLDCVRGCVKPVHERLDVIPGSFVGHLRTAISVPLFSARCMRPKYDRYLRIELQWRGKQSWPVWLRWTLLRNIISVFRQVLVWCCTFFIPRRGPRYPSSMVYEQVRYLTILTWKTCPLFQNQL